MKACVMDGENQNQKQQIARSWGALLGKCVSSRFGRRALRTMEVAAAVVISLGVVAYQQSIADQKAWRVLLRCPMLALLADANPESWLVPEWCREYLAHLADPPPVPVPIEEALEKAAGEP